MTQAFTTGRLSDMDAATLDRLLTRGGGLSDVAAQAAAIGERVRREGDAALLAFAREFDGATLDALEVPSATWHEAAARVPKDVTDAMHAAHANIAAFHRACLPHPVDVEHVPGVRAGRRIVPFARVGIYVPGGRAAYPSTVLMCATPARVAGVRELIVATPPGRDGRVPDATLAACSIAGVDRVFRIGGAQAIFALAHGTASVPRVDKVVGPGNAWVAAAKSLVAGTVAIDAPAGPSEVLVLADASANPRLAAAEMIAQAEHDPRAACLAVASDEKTARAIAHEVDLQANAAERRDVVREALASRGAVLAATDETEMAAFADRFAPEHLVLLTRDPRALLERISHYGSAFLGPWSSVALGDYCSGPNHVLPTAGLARSYSGLGVDDFLRRPTHQHVSREGFARLAPIAERLARFEGLPAHAAAVAARRDIA